MPPYGGNFGVNSTIIYNPDTHMLELFDTGGDNDIYIIDPTGGASIVESYQPANQNIVSMAYDTANHTLYSVADGALWIDDERVTPDDATEYLTGPIVYDQADGYMYAVSRNSAGQDHIVRIAL